MALGGEAGAARRRMAWLMSVAAVALLAATEVAAQGTHVSIPAEDASASIPALAQQSGLQVFAPAEALRGVRTNAVEGNYAPLDALNRLLAGTGLIAVRTGENAVAVRRPGSTAPEAVVTAPGEATAVEGITVTGSRIKRAGFDTLESALTTGSKEIQERGYDNIAQVLQDTPGFGIPGSSPLSSGQARVGVAQSFADFFGLGSQRTLTLVDGQRYVSSNTAQVAGSNAEPGDQVDLNLIPIGLVDHVETIAIGGAPVYGSDAIAGTVNIILKQHFQGLQTSVQYGFADRGDAENGRFSVLAGKNFDNDRGNVVLSAEYDQQQGLLFSARSGLPFAFPNPADTGPTDGIPASIIAQNVHFSFVTEGGLPYDGSILNYPGLTYPGLYPNGNYIHNAAGQPLSFSPTGQLVPFNVGTVVSSALGGLLPIESTGGDGVNAADHFSLLSPTKRALVNFNGHYDLTPDVRVFWESSYAHTQATVLSDLTSIDSPNLISSAAYTLNFSVDNPYLSPQARSIIVADGLTSFDLSRNLNDIVDRTPATTQEDVYRVVGGFDGKLHIWDQEWSWNLSADYGASHTISHDTYINPANLLLAADAVAGPSGSIVCASGGSCVPINLFGQNAFSKAAAAYVSDPVEAGNLNTQFVATANLSGNLPLSIADPIAFNVGAEYRRETANFTADAAWQAGDVLDGVPGYGPVQGSFDTKEIYGETVVPLISDRMNIPLIKSASYEGAIRYVDHSITGGATTWSSGGRISPRLPGWGDGLVLRGVYTHAIRSPSITEFGLPQTGQLSGILDPCDASQVNLGPDPAARLKNCTAALAAAGAGPPAGFNSTTASVSQSGFSGGNPNLKNETANSWSLGFAYQPTMAPKFRLSADWSNIAMKNAIELLAIGDVLDSCYDSTSYPNVPTCNSFTRLTAATLSTDSKLRVVGDIAPGYLQSYFNVATINFSGLIVAAEYGFDVHDVAPALGDAGSLNLGVKLFYTNRFDEVAFAGSPVTSEAGTVAAPRERASFNIDYTYKNFETLWQAQWTSRSAVETSCSIEVLPACDIPSYVLINSTFSYKLTPNLKVQLVIDNLFDKPMPALAVYGRLFSTYDALGRRYLLTLSAAF